MFPFTKKSSRLDQKLIGTPINLDLLRKFGGMQNSAPIQGYLQKYEYTTLGGEEVFLFYKDRGIWKRF